MDLDAPADAWYVYVAVAIVSVALAGLAVGVSTGPPPDAERAATAIEGATGTEYAASASYDHDADVVTINRRTITMDNDHGTAHSSFAYGSVVPVNGHDRLEALASGSAFDEVYADELSDPDTHAVEAFTEEVEDAFADNTGEPLRAGGELRVRTITVDGEADELEPSTEEGEMAVTETSSLPGEPGDNVREVAFRYDGLEDRTVHVTLEGEYAWYGSFSERDSKTFHSGDGVVSIEIRSENVHQPADEPVAFRIDFEGDDESPTESWASDDLEIGEVRTWDNEVEREPDFDHDDSVIGLNDGGNHYVTLVVV